MALVIIPCHGAFAEGGGAGDSAKAFVTTSPPSKVLSVKMTAGDIRRHVTAKSSLFRVMRAATASGVKAEDLMAAILSAGASPADVIYMATVENYPVDVITQEAIMAGVSAEVIFKSAIAAGAVRGDVAKAMSELGASPEDVADAVAKVTRTRDTLP